MKFSESESGRRRTFQIVCLSKFGKKSRSGVKVEKFRKKFETELENFDKKSLFGSWMFLTFYDRLISHHKAKISARFSRTLHITSKIKAFVQWCRSWGCNFCRANLGKI